MFVFVLLCLCACLCVCMYLCGWMCFCVEARPRDYVCRNVFVPVMVLMYVGMVRCVDVLVILCTSVCLCRHW